MKRLYEKNSFNLNLAGNSIKMEVKNAIEPIIQNYLYMGYDEFQLNTILNDVIRESVNIVLNNLDSSYKSNCDRIQQFSTLVKTNDFTVEKNGNLIGQRGDDLLIQFEHGFKPKFPFITVNNEYWLVFYYNRELCDEESFSGKSQKNRI